MSKYLILTKAFWADTLERTVATAAQAVAATWGADQVFPNAFTLDYKVLAGVAAGGALAALVKQLAKLGLTAQVPVEPAKRSGGDVERTPAVQPAPMPMIDQDGVDVNPLTSSGPSVNINTPVTDATVYNYSD